MGQFHWDPDSYLSLMREEVPDYGRLQAEAVRASCEVQARSILELGTGTGETARRILAAHRRARLQGIDASEEMLVAARAALAGEDVQLDVGQLENPLPSGSFDLVVSALAVHHLHADAKAALFSRVAQVLVPGGRFVLADVVVPDDPGDAVGPLDHDYDKPSTVPDQLRWLEDAGLSAGVHWRRRDLAVLFADRRERSSAQTAILRP